MADEKKPDTSSFVEHLRLVHLTLVLTCVISVIALWSQEPSSAGRAYEQLVKLRMVEENWKAGRWIREFSGIDKLFVGEAFATRSGKAPEHFWFQSSIQFVRADGMPVTRGGKDLFDKEASQLDFVDVKHARKIWNALKEVTQIVRPTEVRNGWFLHSIKDPSPEGLTLNDGNPLKLMQGSLPTSFSGNSARWRMRQDIAAARTPSPVQAFVGTIAGESYFVDFGFERQAFIAKGQIMTIGAGANVFEATVEKSGVNLLKELKDRQALQTLPIGNFDTAFPDLAERTKQLEEVKLEDLEKYFSDESRRSADKIDVTFLKFPQDMLAYVGTGLIFILTFYASAILRDLRFRILPGDKAWDVAWIGLSREGWSVALFWLSMLLSLATALLLIENASKLMDSTKIYIMAGTVFAFSPVLAGMFVSWSTLQSAERKLPAPEPMIT